MIPKYTQNLKKCIKNCLIVVTGDCIGMDSKDNLNVHLLGAGNSCSGMESRDTQGMCIL